MRTQRRWCTNALTAGASSRTGSWRRPAFRCGAVGRNDLQRGHALLKHRGNTGIAPRPRMHACLQFSILVLPQVVQNAVNMAAGHSSAMSIISWEVRPRFASLPADAHGPGCHGAGSAHVAMLTLSQEPPPLRASDAWHPRARTGLPVRDVWQHADVQPLCGERGAQRSQRAARRHPQQFPDPHAGKQKATGLSVVGGLRSGPHSTRFCTRACR